MRAPYIMLTDQIPLSSIHALLTKAGLCTTIKAITRCSGGNNRTYRINTKEGCFAIKQYFRKADDLRDRLTSEFNFLTYARTITPQFVPLAYAQDKMNGIALYEFIEGNTIQPHEITEKELQLAIEFFTLLNNNVARNQARQLNLASEACFSFAAHLNLVDTRLEQLNALTPKSAEDKLAKKMINYLGITWHKITKKIQQTVDTKTFEMEIDSSQRCISPSDFGFHNALRTIDGKIRFLDFEYAGWDDPAKMVGDFFSQLAVPIPLKFFDMFTEQVMQPFTNPADLIIRANFLRLVYQVKWCCIALNIFLPTHLERRLFANPDLNVAILKRNQLAKASSLIKLLEYQHGLY